MKAGLRDTPLAIPHWQPPASFPLEVNGHCAPHSHLCLGRSSPNDHLDRNGFMIFSDEAFPLWIGKPNPTTLCYFLPENQSPKLTTDTVKLNWLQTDQGSFSPPAE